MPVLHDDLSRLFDYWQSKRGARAMPARADIDPLEMRWILGRLTLVEVLPDGDYLWRLDGTEIVDFFRTNMTGRRLSDYPRSEMSQLMADEFAAVVQTRSPKIARRVGRIDERIWEYDILRLPLSEDGVTVSMVLSGLVVLRNTPAG